MQVFFIFFAKIFVNIKNALIFELSLTTKQLNTMQNVTANLELDNKKGDIIEVMVWAEYIQEAAAHRDCYGRPTECDTASELHIVCLQIEGNDYTFDEAYKMFFTHEPLSYIQSRIEAAIVEQLEENQSIETF